MESKSKPTGKFTSLHLLAAVFLAGVLAGTLAFMQAGGETGDISGITGSFITTRLGQTYIHTVINSFSGTFPLLLLLFFLGFGSVFQPLEILVSGYKGLGVGLSLAGIYHHYGVNGILLSAALIIPGAVVSAGTLIIAGREALRMSTAIGSLAFSQKSRYERPDLRMYIYKFTVLTAILMISSIIDGILTFLFAGFFAG